MTEKKTNGLVVIENSKPVGIISSLSIIQTIIPPFLKDDPNISVHGAEGMFDEYAVKACCKLVKDVMFSDVHILTEDDAIIEAATFASMDDQRLLPVVKSNEDQTIVGVINRTIIKRACYDALKNGENNCECHSS